MKAAQYLVSMVRKLPVFPNRTPSREAKLRSLVTREADMGGALFEKTGPTTRRQFFAHDENTWVWHEWRNNQLGYEELISTHYEIHGDKIIKKQTGQPHVFASIEEAQNLLETARAYRGIIKKNIYGIS